MELKFWKRKKKELTWDDIDSYSNNYSCESKARAVTFHDYQSDEINLFEQAAKYLKTNHSGRLISVNLSGGEFGSSLNLYFYDNEAESKVLSKWGTKDRGPLSYQAWRVKYHTQQYFKRKLRHIKRHALDKLGLQETRERRLRGGREPRK